MLVNHSNIGHYRHASLASVEIGGLVACQYLYINVFKYENNSKSLQL